MVPSVGKKLSFFSAITVILATFVVGTLSYRFIEARFAEYLRKGTQDSATLLASRVRNEMRHFAEKGRILAAAAIEEFKNPDDQIRFLEENLAIDHQFVALTLYRLAGTEPGGKIKRWAPVFRLSRAEGLPGHLTDQDFKSLDLKFPLELNQLSTGGVEVTVGQLRDGSPIFRMAVPIVRRAGHGFTQILGIEARQERLTAAFAESTAHFSYLIDRRGRVLSQTDPTHFSLAESVSHLPILLMAKATEAPNGNLDFHEIPEGILQYGAFQKIGYGDLMVVSQSPKTHLITVLRDYTRQTGLVSLGCMFLAMFFAMLGCWGIVSSRLAKIAGALEKMGGGTFKIEVPEGHSSDEIGDFSRILQEVTNRLHKREKVFGTYAKFRDPRRRGQIDDGKVALGGERSRVYTLAAQLGGMPAIIEKADPRAIVDALNGFYTSLADKIEASGGVLDRMNGGGFSAFWGVPFSSHEDGERALECVLEVRKVFQAFNQTLDGLQLPSASLHMGMHYGAAVAGQIGTPDRLEYTAFGESADIALKIAGLTEQNGSDFLMTGQAYDHAPKFFVMEKAATSDGSGFDYYELLGRATPDAASSSIRSKATESSTSGTGLGDSEVTEADLLAANDLAAELAGDIGDDEIVTPDASEGAAAGTLPGVDEPSAFTSDEEDDVHKPAA